MAVYFFLHHCVCLLVSKLFFFHSKTFTSFSFCSTLLQPPSFPSLLCHLLLLLLYPLCVHTSSHTVSLYRRPLTARWQQELTVCGSREVSLCWWYFFLKKEQVSVRDVHSLVLVCFVHERARMSEGEFACVLFIAVCGGSCSWLIRPFSECTHLSPAILHADSWEVNASLPLSVSASVLRAFVDDAGVCVHVCACILMPSFCYRLVFLCAFGLIWTGKGACI